MVEVERGIKMTDARDQKFRFYTRRRGNDKWEIGDYPLREIWEGNYLWLDPYHKLVAVVRSTGMIDTNGQEIFEGDIVTGDKMRGVVKWSKSGYRWYVDDRYAFDSLAEFNSSVTGLEILGNEYQNPEMMEEAKE